MDHPELKLAFEPSGVAVLTLANPATLNAISPSLCEALTQTLRRLSSGEAGPDGRRTRAIVLTGEGRAFCSGADLGEAAALVAAEGGPDLQRLVELFYIPVSDAIRSLEIPLVTAVNGVAAGIGCAYALMGDLVVAAETASFSAAFGRIGLVPDGGSTWLLPRLAGRARAMEMALLGEPVPAAQALEWGLVNRCVPVDALMPTALELARRLAGGPASLAMTRKLMWEGLDAGWRTQLANEARAQGEAGKTADFREGVAAFAQKRAPRFEGK